MSESKLKLILGGAGFGYSSVPVPMILNVDSNNVKTSLWNLVDHKFNSQNSY